MRQTHKKKKKKQSTMATSEELAVWKEKLGRRRARDLTTTMFLMTATMEQVHIDKGDCWDASQQRAAVVHLMQHHCQSPLSADELVCLYDHMLDASHGKYQLPRPDEATPPWWARWTCCSGERNISTQK